MPLSGAELAGHAVLRPLGRGGSASVYLVRDRVHGTLRALKVGDTRGLASEEARCQRRVVHDSVPPLLAATDQGLLSPFVDGPELGELLRAGALPVEAAEALAARLYDVVEAVHDAGVVHRDLSLRNLLVTPSAPHLHLIDFGIALDLRAPRPVEAGPLGTPGFAAPEQLADPGGVDQRADLYSLGAVVFALMTGRAAFPQPDEEDRMRAATSPDWAEGVFGGVALPPAAARALRAALDPDPDRRPATVAALRALWEPRRGDLPASTVEIVEALRPSERWGGLRSLPPSSAAHAWDDPLAEVTAGPATGPRRIGRYTLYERLGSGAVGVVWRGWDPVAEREVAVKMLRKTGGASTVQQLRFQREVRALARLDHPHIVRLLDADVADAAVWFAMELVDGPTLASRLAQDGPMPWRDAAQLGVDLADALQHAHGRGLVHRDIKPDNVVCGPRGAALTDFGVALDLQASTVLTAGEQVLGTPAYMAPEQILEPSEVRQSSDIYGLGALLFEALSGRPPREGRDLEVIGALMRPAPPPPLPDTVPADLRHVVGRAMAWEPTDRYPSAEAFGRDLQRCLRGEPVEAAAPSLRRRIVWWAREHPLLGAAAFAALLIAVVLVLGAGAGRAWNEHRRAERADMALSSALERLERRKARDDPEGAITAFEAFLEQTEIRNTNAAAEGWLYVADQRRDDPDRGLDALARAYTAADAPEVQLEVLMAQAERNRDRYGWPKRLQVIGAVLHEDLAPLLGDPRARALAREADLSRRDFDRVEALDPRDPMLPVLRALQPMTPTDHAVPGGVSVRRWRSQRVLDLDTPDGLVTVSLEGTPFQRVPEAEPHAGNRVFATPEGMDGLFLSPARAAVDIVDQAGQSVLSLGIPGQGWLASSAVGDLDEDGREETWLGLNRTLLRVDYAGGRPVGVAEGHAATNASNSDIDGLAIADFDGDGHLELAMAMGPWGAYDLRLLGWRDGAMAMLGRTKLGLVTGVAAVPDPLGGPPLLAVSRGPSQPSALVWRDARMTDVFWSLVLLKWTGTELVEQLQVQQPTQPRHAVGDFDGDGRADVAWQSGDGTLLLRHDGAAWRTANLDGITPLLAADLDGDGDDELIAGLAGRLVVLGMGTARIPVLPRADRSARQLKLSGPGPLARSVRRAETLGELGFERYAADRLVALADAWEDRGERAAILHRAAQLSQLAVEDAEAIALYEQAADLDPTIAGPALSEAVQLAAQGLDLGHAAALQRRLVASGGQAVDPLLDADAAALDQRVDLDLSQPLDLRWEIIAASGVRRKAGGLGVGVLHRDEALARLPLRWAGGAVSLEVEGDTVGMDWAGGINIGLRSADGALLTALRFSRGGGGGAYWDTYACALTNTNQTLPSRSWVGYTVLRRGGAPRCRVVSGDYDAWVRGELTAPADFGAALTLELSTSSSLPLDPRGRPWVGALIRRLRIQGVSLAEAPSDPDARHALADSRPALALERLARRRDGGAQLLRAEALRLLGRPGAAAAAREALALSSDELPADLLTEVRANPDLWMAPLLSQRPRTAYALLFAAWAITATQDPDAPAMLDMARRSQATLDLLSGPMDLDRLRLLVIRGRAWAAEGQWTLARQTLNHARDAAMAAPPGPTRQQLLQQILLLQARDATLSGNTDGALRDVWLLLHESPAPSVTAEMLWANPVFDILHDQAGWAELVEPARLRGARPPAPP